MKPNILFISTLNLNPGGHGGQEIFIKKLSKILVEEKYPYIIASPSSLNSGSEFFITNEKKNFFKTLFNLKKIIKTHNINLIHSNDCYSNFLAFFLMFLTLFKIKTTSIIHDDYYSEYMPSFLKFKKKIYYHIDKTILFFFHSNLFYSDFLMTKLLFRKSIYLSPGIESGKSEKRKKSNNSKLKIGWAGRPDFFKKGFDIFFEIIKKYSCNGGDAEFHIAGFNAACIIDESIFHKTHNVIFHGYVEDINSFFKEIDILVISSRYEGLCLLFLEALSNKIPVVYSDIPVFVHIAKSLNYPIPPAKTEIPDEFISAIKNISSLNSEFLNEIPDKIRELYS
ncbi:glycosyltransferase family 4 protein, partial [Candidatus Dependentiae bacterium]|nr:glycosyltransferase family 4 protein [Candidatus Dependentiae bacterium]